MHICILYQNYLSAGDPGNDRFNEYSRLWADRGHRVSVVTGQAPNMTGVKHDRYRRRACVHERDGRVDVYRCYVPDRANGSFTRRAASYFAFAASSTWAYGRLDRPDVLICSSPPLFIGLGMLLIRNLHRVPTVFEVRDLWPESAITTGVLKNRAMIAAMYGLERRCYREAARINVLTEGFRADIVGRGLADDARIFHLPNGVDTSRFTPECADPSLRAELGWGDKFVVLYSGAHGVANRVGQLLDAAHRLRDRPEVLIATVGAGMELEPLRERAAREGLTNVRLHGPMPRSMMPSVVASADACAAVLQRNDTFKAVYPNKVFDAMACGRPIVVAIDGLARELVEGPGAGLYAEPEDGESLAAAIRRLADDRRAAAEMGRRGREFVVANFDRTTLGERYLDVLGELVGAAVAEVMPTG